MIRYNNIWATKTDIIIMVIIIHFLPLNFYELNHEISGSKKIKNFVDVVSQAAPDVIGIL